MKNFKKNQVVILVIALMLMTAGYLNYTNQNKNSDLIPTSSLADSEQMASIGDATLVNANQITESNLQDNENNIIENKNKSSDKENENTNENEVNTNTYLVENCINNQIEEDSYYAQSRLDRDNMYSQMISNYQKILETDNLDKEEKATAQKEITKINNEKNAIMIAENLIKTKEFSDVVIFKNNGNVTVIVKSEKLDEQQIAQIQNIIMRELKVKANMINISSKN